MDAARGRKLRRRSGETGGVSSSRGGFYSPISCIVSHIVTFTEVGSSFVNQLCADFL